MTKLIFMLMFLAGCSNSDPEINKDLKDLKRINEANQKQIAIMHCDTGVLFTVSEFRSLLKGKVKHGQLDKIWAKCEELK